MKNLLCSVLPLLALSAIAMAQTPHLSSEITKRVVPRSNSSTASLSLVLDQAVSRLPAGGVIAAEADEDSVRYFDAGNPAPRKGIPPEKVIFEIGSITKVFTGLLLAQAVVEHKVALDDPISRYLPPTLKMDRATAAITLEQLATHTSGLPRWPINLHLKDPTASLAAYTVGDLYEFLQNYRSKTPAPHLPVYSNVGVALLGHVLELVYQQPFADLILNKISRPLGLPDTVVNLDKEQRERFAIPHSGPLALKPFLIPTLAGAGALHSTAADLVRFARMLMTPDQNPLRAAWEIARQPRHDYMGESVKIGLNVFILDRDKAITYWHDGETIGTRSYLEWSPQAAHHVLVILLNNNVVVPESIVASLHPIKKLPLPNGKAKDYVGDYSANTKTTLTFIAGPNGGLLFRITGKTFIPIFYIGSDRFLLPLATNPPIEMQFGRSTNGDVDDVTLIQYYLELMKAHRSENPVARPD